LKLTPFRRWLVQFAGRRKWMFVGIRADESERIAFTIPEVETEMPFIDMRIRRDDVFRLLSETVGIPKTYAYRTRSGCSMCPFQRRSELCGLLQNSPDEFALGEACEKVAQQDLARWTSAVPLWKDSRLSRNWLSLPLPSATDTIDGKTSRGEDLFGHRIWVGGEFFFAGMPGYERFIWQQRIVTFSPTLHHLKPQLDDRYRHLLDTSEVHGMSPDEVREGVEYAIWLIELPANVFDPREATGEGYTWQQGWAFARMRHVLTWVERALQAEQMKREAEATVRSELSVQAEWRDAAQTAIANLSEATGAVVCQAWYRPTEVPRELDEDETLRLTPCPMCSI
jgi:hypothetical protein